MQVIGFYQNLISCISHRHLLIQETSYSFVEGLLSILFSSFTTGIQKGKLPAENPEKGPSSSQEGHKRRRTSQDGYADTSLQSQLTEVLERNSQMLTEQLEAQNVNNQLDREQRKDQANGLLGVLNKVADALARIADKLQPVYRLMLNSDERYDSRLLICRTHS